MAKKSELANPVGRPTKQIDWEQFQQLCALQCTKSECASVLHISESTLLRHIQEHYEENFETIYKKYSECGKTSLRRFQFNLAKTNAAMAIWLGKQMLNQRDRDQEDVKKYSKGIYENVTSLIKKQNDNPDLIAKAS